MIERTLVLLKPDAVQRALVGEIIHRIERTGLKIVGMKLIHADPKTAGDHYYTDEAWLKSVGEKTRKSYESKGIKVKETDIQIGQNIRKMLIDFLSMSPVVAVCFEGHNAVSLVRKFVGSTNPEDALPGTIRGDYSVDSYRLADHSKRPVQNLIHASGSRDEAKREIKIWFTDKELYNYTRVDQALIYRGMEDK